MTVPVSNTSPLTNLAAIGQFDLQQYQRQIGTHWYDLELVASDNLTLARAEGRYPIIGTWKGGFIVLHEGQPRAVGKSEAHHNLLPISARLIEGEPLRNWNRGSISWLCGARWWCSSGSGRARRR